MKARARSQQSHLKESSLQNWGVWWTLIDLIEVPWPDQNLNIYLNYSIYTLDYLKINNQTVPIQTLLSHSIYKLIQSHKQMFKANDYKRHHSSSSESDASDAEASHGQKVPQSRKPEGEGKQQFEKDPEDSLSEEDSSIESPRGLSKKYGLGENKADESDEEDDKSIDQIEERIKKLEKDLEQRIGKHTKAKPSQQSANEKLKPVGAPPLPKKDLSSSKKPEDKPLTTNHPQSKSKLQSAFQLQKSKKESARTKQQKLFSPKKKDIPDEHRNPVGVVHEKQRIQSRNPPKEAVHGYHAQQLMKANKQIEQLQKTIAQLKAQNKKLKDQAKQYKKKKPVDEVDRLNELSSVQVQGNTKLQKQLELLKIIEGLQLKIKKSINKKLGKGKMGCTSAALLHRGLPANALC